MEGTYDFRISKINYATIIQSKNVTVSNHIFNFQLQSAQPGVLKPGYMSLSGHSAEVLPGTLPMSELMTDFIVPDQELLATMPNSDMSITLTFSSGGKYFIF